MVTPPIVQRRSLLHLCVPPDRSGSDGFSLGSASFIAQAGICTNFKLIWPQTIYRLLNSGRLPFGRRLFRQVAAPFYASRQLKRMQAGDVAWILSFCVPTAEVPAVEATLKAKSVSYIFQLSDDWFDVEYLRRGTINRCLLADLVGVPTPQLAQRVREVVPKAKVAVFEEPIDLDRLKAGTTKHFKGKPIILWCGNPHNLRLIRNFLDVLRRVRMHTPFVLRVICGQKPPSEFSHGLDFEWKQFDHHLEGHLITGSWFGIAPMDDSAYNRCKGAYKVKTYMAAGLPVVASPVGFQSDLVRGGQNVGLLPESPAEWEQNIRLLLTNPSLCAEMGAQSRVYAEQRFSFRAIAQHWAATLQSHFPTLSEHNFAVDQDTIH